MNIQEFWDKLVSHDWYYSFSDDYGVYKRGQANQDKLRNIASSSPEHRTLYDQFRDYHNAAIAGKEPNPLPDRPKVINNKPEEKKEKEMEKNNEKIGTVEAFLNNIKKGDFALFPLFRFRGHKAFGNTLVKVQYGVPSGAEDKFPEEAKNSYFLSVWKYKEDNGKYVLLERLTPGPMFFNRQSALIWLQIAGLKWAGTPNQNNGNGNF